VIGDCHSRLSDKELDLITNQSFDKCVLLGDIGGFNLSLILSVINKDKICGVLGNHDSLDLYKRYDVEELHYAEINGITFVGLGGCHRYKRSTDVPLLTHEESVTMLNNAPAADVLITHDAPFSTLYNKNPNPHGAHCGLRGITEYIKAKRPKFHIHGHLHINAKNKLYKTKIFSVYKCAVFEYPSGKIQYLF
jgi:Icc-related predicted phosphoesterase